MLHAFCLSLLVLVQQKPPSVSLPHDWAVGTRLAVEMTRGRTEYENDQQVRSGSTKTLIDFEVLAKRADGYTFRWKLGKNELVEGTPTTDPLSLEVMTLNEDLDVDFTTDATGSVRALVAPERIEQHYAKGLDRIQKELGGEGLLDEKSARAIEAWRISMRGREFRESLLREPSIVYMPSGSNLVLGEKRTYQDSLPNPFGGEPLPAVGFLELREIRADRHEAVVEWRLSIDAERARGLLEESVRAMARRTGKPPPPENARVGLEAIEDAATYVYDTQTGWPISVVYTRTSVMAGVKTIDHVRLDSKPVEKVK